MAAEEYGGVDPFEVFRLGAPLTLHRIVKTDAAYDPELLDSFRSKYERGGPPLKIEKRSTPVHMGLSMYATPGAAHLTARQFPKIGSYVARVELQPGNGFAFAMLAEPGHLTVWGRPLQLVRMVVDIVPVE